VVGAPGNGPEVEWVYGYGGWETEEHPHAAIQARDGGFVIVGEATGYAGSRIFVVRTDERGTLRFARSYGVGRFNLANFVLEEADGSFLIAGSWDVGAEAVREDRVLLRLAGDGEVRAMRTYPAPGAGTSHPYDFDAAHDGGYILAGHLATCPGGCWDGWLVRVDAAGREVWGAPERMYEECYGVRTVPGGGYVTACGSGVEPGNEVRPDDPLNTWRAYVVRVTEAGTVQWQASYGSPHANNAAEFVLPTRDGGFAVFADSDEHGAGEGANIAIYKLAGDPPR
jgi:hypothetical protein